MSFRGKLSVLLISGAIALYAVVGGLPLVGSLLNANAQQAGNDKQSQLRLLDAVLQHIQNDYVDDPDMSKVRLGALRGLPAGLDPYSSYLTPEQVKEYRAGPSEGKVGIGAEFSQVSGFLYVVSVVKGGPADKAGIKAGDVIEYIDGKASRDVSLYDAVQIVLGKPDTQVALRVLRSTEKPQTIKVTRGSYTIPKAESRIEAGKIGVVKVFSLEEGESADIRSNIESLKKQGVEKIILDLRGVAGGKLDEGAAVANLFIKDGVLATIQGQEGKVLKSYSADPAKTIFDGEAAVLVNLSTAGAAEAVAAAFNEKKRGEVIGERTFGAGTEQQLFTLKSGDGLLLTVARWASGDGKPFLGENKDSMGIKPSIEVKRTDIPEPLDPSTLVENPTDPNATPTPTPTPKAAASDEDIQLKKALEVLSGKAQAAKAG
ncbi:MAG: PDZ domain-containing protein [Chloracidobacterium sp.]|nr:PDZ domain-containing protein [Chloracidobacterium sp.]